MARYNDPHPARDDWARDLYLKHGLGDAPSMDQIEPIATRLLGDPDTALEGAELVMGRRIDVEETQLAISIYIPMITARKRFAQLLVALVDETSMHSHVIDEELEAFFVAEGKIPSLRQKLANCKECEQRYNTYLTRRYGLSKQQF